MPLTKGAAPVTIVVVGGGFTGAVLALKLARARPQDSIRLVERCRRAGVGLAYGACSPPHLLNVPVSRMESGLSRSFSAWLEGCGEDLSDALRESGGRLEDAFAPRALFGRYMEERLAEALSPGPGPGLHRVRGTAVRMLDLPRRGVVLEDGREVGRPRGAGDRQHGAPPRARRGARPRRRRGGGGRRPVRARGLRGARSARARGVGRGGAHHGGRRAEA